MAQDDIQKQFNTLSSQAKTALINLSRTYREKGTYRFKLSDVGGPGEAARNVLDYLTDRGYLLRGGNHEDPNYRLTKSIIDSLIHDGVLDLDPSTLEF